MITSTIRLNLALPGQDPQENAKRHQAILPMVERADAAGLTAISLEEHHGVVFEDTIQGWCASPIALAAAIVARTTRAMVSLWGIALPLHDPLRIAEDVATLDLLAPGRVVLTINTGYRPAEFAAHNVRFEDREELFATKLEQLRAAWLGEPIAKDGFDVVVTPRPASQPHPMLLAGGSNVGDARNAARHGLPFRPSADVAELRTAYEEACAAEGHDPLYLAPSPSVTMVQIAEDPDRWWSLVGEHLLSEARIYASWMQADDHSAVHSRATTVDELRAEGTYRVVTPDQAIDLAKHDRAILFHPLAGGTPLPLVEETAELFIERVLPALD